VSKSWQHWAWVGVAVLVAFVSGRMATPGAVGPPSYADAFDALAPGVVNVTPVGAADGRIGSGFFVSADEVMTARHLVVDVESAEIRGIDGIVRTATVVGMDARTDLALLQVVSPGDPHPASLGSSESVRVGDSVLAIGNPFGLSHSLSVGVVAQLARRLGRLSDGPRVNFIQLSIPLNPGNSGGPVFDLQGRVVGVLAGTHAQGQAIAFAVPVEVLRSSLAALRRGENISRSFLGARLELVGASVEVVGVVPSGPADRAGLRPGDQVVWFAESPVSHPDDLYRRLDELAGGTMAPIRLQRSGVEHTVDVTLSDWAEQPVVVAGMTLRPEAGTGGRVVAVRQGSRAAAAGVHESDELRAVDGVPVQAPAAVKARVRNETIQLEVVRAGAVVVLRL
jgi:serine protease Do